MIARDLNSSKEDIDELLAMYADLEKDEGTSYLQKVNDIFEIFKRPDCKCFIFEVDNKIVGFAIIYADMKGGCIGESLYIKEEYRGTKLFINIFKHLQEYVNTKYHYCNLIASNDNVSSLYRKMGYNVKYIVYQYKRGENG